jgi:uncharacterized protein (DUF2141 family)
LSEKYKTKQRLRGTLTLLFLSTVLTAQESTLEVTISNIRPGPGIVRMAICDHPDHFPDKPVLFYNFPKGEIRDSTISITVPGLKAGDYAITLLDDTNENEKMDTGLMGIPKEGFGFSNDIKPNRKSPPFEECTFRISKGANRLTIHMQYFGK